MESSEAINIGERPNKLFSPILYIGLASGILGLLGMASGLLLFFTPDDLIGLLRLIFWLTISFGILALVFGLIAISTQRAPSSKGVLATVTIAMGIIVILVPLIVVVAGEFFLASFVTLPFKI